MKEKREKISFKEPIHVSKFRFWAGLVVSILLSFSVYQFFIFSRDLLRLLTFSDHFNYLAFSENELLFYNLFYAFLALIIGQSYFLKIIFDTNKKFGEKRIQFKRKKIVHNQNIWIWFFLLWFLRFATMYSFLNMVGFGQKVNYAPVFYEYFSFYEEYPYLFVLIVLALFLQSWQGLGLTINNYFKYLMGSFILLSVLAFGFTKINLMNVEQYFKKQHAQNPYIKENIQLPKVPFTQSLSLRHKKKEFFITKDLKIIYNNQELDSIGFLMNILEKDKYPQYSIFKSFIQLNVDENVSIGNLDKILRIINRNSNYQIAFAALPKETKLKKIVYQEHPVGLFESNSIKLNYENLITLHLTSENEILLNNNSISCDEIANTIAKIIAENENYLISIELPEKPLHSHYMQLLSYSREAYLKACQIIGREKGMDDFTIAYFPNQILDFNMIEAKQLEILSKIDFNNLPIPTLEFEDEEVYE
ncbi:hypothetical protein FIA58_008300 [Flavobacterium jejuense]|uniref:Uncharacterized protein n=1 Tax=Flavobacterium jejuense TaxID=1544455 RepID=A0ABX0IS44_9FLAO|nr:hypothetical protein [Flavobacterium jejuense]NHN25677.1 hypothetical protein [Flavobacterium jejuense]